MDQPQNKASQAVQIVVSLLIFFGYIWVFIQKDNPLGERFLTAGFGLMIGFLFYFILTSMFNGVSKNEIKVPIKTTVLVIVIGVLHMLIGGYLGIET